MNPYFDNACTSFPKPKEVGEYMQRHIIEGGSYGRSSYTRIFNSSKVVEDTRDLVASFMGISKAENVIFSANSTAAINTILSGFSFLNRKVYISPLEHNAVTRPIEHLKTSIGLTIEVLPHKSDGLVDTDALRSIDFKGIDLVIVNHVSNVNGVIQPINVIKSSIGNTPMLVDASQSVGKVDIKVDEWNLDYLAFTGHKGLLGPTGTGGFYVKDTQSICPTQFGGTGSNSESFDMPTSMPDKFQPGTPNVTGIYGLLGALKNKPKVCWDQSRFALLLENLKTFDGLRVFAANNSNNQSDVFSIFPENGRVSELSRMLFQKYSIEIRSGLHCSPLAHKTLRTFPKGTVRVSLSPYHTNRDIDHLEESILKLLKHGF